MLNQETAKAARTDSGYILRAPRRMRVADAVAQYMRVAAVANAGLLIVTTSRSHCAVTATGRASELIRPAIRKTGMSC